MIIISIIVIIIISSSNSSMFIIIITIVIIAFVPSRNACSMRVPGPTPMTRTPDASSEGGGYKPIDE